MSEETQHSFVQENYGLLRFFSMALIIYGAFYLFYSYIIIESAVFIRYLEISASLGADLVNAVSNVDVEVKRAVDRMTRIQATDRSYVVVAQGCDASTVFAVLISTLLAWPGKWRVKIPVLLFGLLLMFGLNIIRIAGMSITESLIPDWFDLMHEWLLPPLLVLGALTYFYIWTLFSDEHPGDIKIDQENGNAANQ